MISPAGWIRGGFGGFGAVCVLVCGVALPTATAEPTEPALFDLQAHRGGRGETTEGSLAAFAKSLETGVSTLEFDIVLSADRQPMVWHDPVITPETCADTAPAFAGDPQYPYVHRPVRALTLAQLRTLDCDRPLPDFPDAEVVHGNTIATLPEVFALTDRYRADVRYNIETKVAADRPDTSADPQQLVDAILAAVRAAGKVGAVEIQSFDWRTLSMVRAAEPSIPLVALWDDATWWPGSPWLAGIDPAVVADPIVAAGSVGATVLAPHYPTVDSGFVDRAHRLGFRVIPWTVNDADAMVNQITAGVDGFITDYPARAREMLAQFGIALPPAFRPG